MKGIWEYLKEDGLSSSLELYTECYRVPFPEKAKDMATFTYKLGIYSFEVMSFGLINAAATLKRVKNE